MANYDKKVLDCFLRDQLQLFPEKVASTPEEADEFLEMMFAVVVKGKRGVRKYFEEVGVDMAGDPDMRGCAGRARMRKGRGCSSGNCTRRGGELCIYRSL